MRALCALLAQVSPTLLCYLHFLSFQTTQRSKTNMAAQAQTPTVIDLDDDSTGITQQYRIEHGSAAAPPAAAVLIVPGAPGPAMPMPHGRAVPRREKTRSPVRAASAREPRQMAAKAVPAVPAARLAAAKEQQLEAQLAALSARVGAVEQHVSSASP